MASCCPTDSHECKGSVGGTVFTHSCNKFATVYDKTPKNAAIPHDCAEICSKDSSCIAGTWNGRKGQCYITYQGNFVVPISTAKFILITKTQEQVHGGPLRPNTDDIAHCNEERTLYGCIWRPSAR
ncbi:hypothetical protein ColLi_14000 [Colletotrichum liriopes]|uniref:Apple domain-containing protein n=1 Tax=Colletotrichum liriopes TaxID=708192 RepID=A0AA37H1U7_9PEZI|nr:hypothetical protein ColLi_14000 [Colletotrichum liriopes]